MGALFGVSTRSAIAANREGPTPISTSGRSEARAGSKETTRAKVLSKASIRVLNVAAISLKALYCNKRAKRRSLASSKARSSSSSTSPLGNNLAALRSSRVAATTKNSVAWSNCQPSPESSRPRMKEMNSSVTALKATSVMSILCREISWRRRSKGPSKLVK